MKKSKRLLSVLLAAVMITSIASGCKKREDTPASSGASSSASSSSSPASSKPPRDPSKPAVSTVIPDLTAKVAEKKAINPDTVGWLQIPDLGIDDVVVCNFEDNQYYLRLNFEKKYDFNGLFYADRRSVFGSGAPEELGTNTCIYGHAMTDSMEDDKFNVKFGPLHTLREPDAASHIPYIFFSTEKANLAFEIIAVFIADSNKLAYNNNDVPPEEFRKLVKDEILPRSIYNYNAELRDDDKYITLSTCIYELPDGTPTNYPKTHYRYAVLGRLADPEDELITEVTITPNESMILDPDSYGK